MQQITSGSEINMEISLIMCTTLCNRRTYRLIYIAAVYIGIRVQAG